MKKKERGQSVFLRLFFSFLTGLHSLKPSRWRLPKRDYCDPLGYCTAPEEPHLRKPHEAIHKYQAPDLVRSVVDYARQTFRPLQNDLSMEKNENTAIICGVLSLSDEILALIFDEVTIHTR
jgi:hypothetical protein